MKQRLRLGRRTKRRTHTQTCGFVCCKLTWLATSSSSHCLELLWLDLADYWWTVPRNRINYSPPTIRGNHLCWKLYRNRECLQCAGWDWCLDGWCRAVCEVVLLTLLQWGWYEVLWREESTSWLSMSNSWRIHLHGMSHIKSVWWEVFPRDHPLHQRILS